jgi:Family of unknown function (DUF6364)
MNLTLAIDDHVLRAARKIAAEQDTTVNQLVREYLERLISDRRKIAREKLLEFMDNSTATFDTTKWKREDLYERGSGRRVR